MSWSQVHFCVCEKVHLDGRSEIDDAPYPPSKFFKKAKLNTTCHTKFKKAKRNTAYPAPRSHLQSWLQDVGASELRSHRP